MTRFVGTPLRGIEFNSVSDEAISARVNGDAQPRIRIDAGGRLTWTSGANTTGQVELYRDAADLLTTPDVFKATAGLVTLTTNGAPSAALPNGAIAVDTTNHVFYFRSNDTWNVVSGGGASLSVSDTAPASPEEGDLWYDSTSGVTYVYYDSYWVQQSSLLSDTEAIPLNVLSDVTITSPSNGQVLKYNGTAWVNDTDNAGTSINALNDIGDVTITSASSGQFLKWNGSAWVNEAIDLATDTVGNYVSDITAGTGVSVSHTPGEGSSPTVSIGQAVDTAANVQFYSVETTENLTVGGDLIVNGTTTTINTSTLQVEDNIVTLNHNAISPTNNAGIEVNRGMTYFVPAIRWNEMLDRWEFTNNGTDYTPVGGNFLTSSSNAAIITMDIGV